MKSVVLSKCKIRRGKEEKSEEEKAEREARIKQQKKEKSRSYAFGEIEEQEQERRLKVVATKGVVTLFNSVNAFQNQKRKEKRVEGLIGTEV